MLALFSVFRNRWKAIKSIYSRRSSYAFILYIFLRGICCMSLGICCMGSFFSSFIFIFLSDSPRQNCSFHFLLLAICYPLSPALTSPIPLMVSPILWLGWQQLCCCFRKVGAWAVSWLFIISSGWVANAVFSAGSFHSCFFTWSGKLIS